MKKRVFLFLIIIISALILTGCLELVDKEELGNVSIPVEYIDHIQLEQSSTYVGYHYHFIWETAEEAVSTVYYRESVDGDSDDEGWILVEGVDSVDEDNPRIKEIVSNDNTYFLSNYTYDIMFVSEIEEYSGKKIMEELFTVGKTQFVDGIEGVFEYNEDSQPAGLDGNFYVGIWNQSEISGPPYNYEVITYEELDENNQAPFFVGGYYETEYKLAIWREFDGDRQPDIDLPKTEAIYIHPGVVLINKPSGDQDGGTIINDVCLVSEPSEVPNQVLYVQQPDQGTTIDPGIETIDYTMAVKNQWGLSYTKTGIISFEPTNPDISLNNTALDYDPSVSIEPVHSVKLSTDEEGANSTEIKAWFEGYKDQTEVLSNTIYLNNVNILLTVKYNSNEKYEGDIIIKVFGSSDGGGTYDVQNSTITIPSSQITSDDSFPAFVYDLPDDKDPIVVPGNYYLVYGFRDYNGGDNIGSYDIHTDAYGEFTFRAKNQDEAAVLVLTEVAMAKDSISSDFNPAGNIFSGDTISNVKIELKDQWGNLYDVGTETISITSNESGINIIPSVSPLETSTGELTTDITFLKTQSGNQTGDIIFTWEGTNPVKTFTYNDFEIKRNTIQGEVTYNDNGLVTSGNIIIELWDNASYSGSRLTRRIKTYAGSGNYSFEFNAPNSGAGINYYLRAYRDYNGDENYDDLTDPYFEYTTPIEVNHTNVNAGNIGTFDNGDVVSPRQIRSIDITQPSTYTELKSGNNVSVTVTSRDQWGNVFGDTSESLNFNWDTTPSSITINPSTGITVDGSGITSANLTLTTSADESNKLYVELDSDNSINDTSSNNIRVDGLAPSWSLNPTITETNPDSIDLRVRINEDGKVYYGIYASGATPSVADIVAGVGALANGDKDPLGAGVNHTFNNIGSLTSETDYEVFAVAEDTLGNRQTSAYQISFTTGDNTPPSWEGSTPYIDTNIGETTADLIVQINEAGTVYYAVYLGTASEPAVADLKSGSGSIANGSNTVSASTPYTFNITGLSALTSYRVYAVAEDTSGNTQTSPLSYDDFQTIDLTPPSWEASTPSLSGANDDSVDLTVQINEAGTVYYVVVSDGSTAPTSAEVKGGSATGQVLSGSQVLAASTSTNINDIGSGILASGTSYDMYIVAEDNETTPNIQASPVLRGFTTTTSSDTTPPGVYDAVAFAGTKTVIITFDEDIVSTAINHDDFTISVNGSAPGVVTISSHIFGQKTLTLSLTGGNLVSTDDIDITFTKNLGAGIQDTSGNELTTFTYNNIPIL